MAKGRETHGLDPVSRSTDPTGGRVSDYASLERGLAFERQKSGAMGIRTPAVTRQTAALSADRFRVLTASRVAGFGMSACFASACRSHAPLQTSQTTSGS